jgi:hypothetical protein
MEPVAVVVVGVVGQDLTELLTVQRGGDMRGLPSSVIVCSNTTVPWWASRWSCGACASSRPMSVGSHRERVLTRFDWAMSSHVQFRGESGDVPAHLRYRT